MKLTVELTDEQRAALAEETLGLLVGLHDRLLTAPAAVTYTEAGRQLDVGVSTIKRMVTAGDLQPVVWSSGSARIPQWQIWALVGDPRLAAWTDAPTPTEETPE